MTRVYAALAALAVAIALIGYGVYRARDDTPGGRTGGPVPTPTPTPMVPAVVPPVIVVSSGPRPTPSSLRSDRNVTPRPTAKPSSASPTPTPSPTCRTPELPVLGCLVRESP